MPKDNTFGRASTCTSLKPGRELFRGKAWSKLAFEFQLPVGLQVTHTGHDIYDHLMARSTSKRLAPTPLAVAVNGMHEGFPLA
jgi:hypothetical protein